MSRKKRDIPRPEDLAYCQQCQRILVGYTGTPPDLCPQCLHPNQWWAGKLKQKGDHSLGQALRAYREKTGIPQWKIAEEVGVMRKTIQLIESGVGVTDKTLGRVYAWIAKKVAEGQNI